MGQLFDNNLIPGAEPVSSDPTQNTDQIFATHPRIGPEYARMAQEALEQERENQRWREHFQFVEQARKIEAERQRAVEGGLEGLLLDYAGIMPYEQLDRIRQESPIFYDKYKSDENFARYTQSIDKAGLLERGIDYLTDYPQAVGVGAGNIAIAAMRHKQVWSGLSRDEERFLDWLHETTDEMREDVERSASGVIRGTFDFWQYPIVAAEQVPNLVLGLSAAMVGGGLGAIAGSVVPGAGTAAGAVAGRAAGLVSFTTFLESGLIADELIQGRIDRGEEVDLDEIWDIAHGFGLVNGLFEAAGMKALSLTIPKHIRRNFLKGNYKQALRQLIGKGKSMDAAKLVGTMYTVNLAQEGVTEFFQEGMNAIASEMDAEGFEEEGDFLRFIAGEEFWERAMHGAIKGMQAASVLGAPGTIAGYRSQQNQSERAKLRQKAIGQSISQEQRSVAGLDLINTLNEYSDEHAQQGFTEEMEDYIGDVMEQAESETIYVDAEALLDVVNELQDVSEQETADTNAPLIEENEQGEPVAIAGNKKATVLADIENALGDTTVEDIEEAAKLDQNIAIPANKWVTRVAPHTDIREQLMPKVKLKETDLNAEELVTAAETREAQTEEAIEEARREIEVDEEEARAVSEDIVGRVKALVVAAEADLSDEKIEAGVALKLSHLKARAVREDISLAEAAEKYGLEFAVVDYLLTEDGKPQVNQMFDALRGTVATVAAQNGVTVGQMLEKVMAVELPTNEQGQVLAPNGEVSNLNKWQAKLTRTPEFKAWFGNSKVVDDNGEPMVVYHGTFSASPIDKFWTHLQMGAHFGTSDQANMRVKSWAVEGSKRRLAPVFLRIENPIRLNDLGDFDSLYEMERDMSYDYMYPGSYEPTEKDTVRGKEVTVQRPFSKEDLGDMMEIAHLDGREDNMGEVVQEALINKGYDGIIYKNLGEAVNGAPDDSYIIFNDNQQSSALGIVRNPVTMYDSVYMEDHPVFGTGELSTRVPTKKDMAGIEKEEHLTVSYDDFIAVTPTTTKSGPNAGKKNLTKAEENLKKIATAKEPLRKGGKKVLVYPMVKPMKGTRRQKAEAYIEFMKENLLWLHDHWDKELRKRSRKWYDGGNKMVKMLAKRYGLTEPQAAGIIAVLSPQRQWFMNMSNAERVMDILLTKANIPMSKQMEKMGDRILYLDDKGKPKKSKKPHIQASIDLNQKLYEQMKGQKLNEITAPDKSELELKYAIWLRLYDQSHNERTYRQITPEGHMADWDTNNSGGIATLTWGSFDEISKAVSILLDGSLENISDSLGKNHKVRSFYNNLMNPNSEYGHATIDTHAVDALHLMPWGAADYAPKQNFGGNASNADGMIGIYPFAHEAYLRAAAERDILPREMQSITWEAVRGLFHEDWKTEANKEAVHAIWMRYRKGDITAEQAREEILEEARGVNEPSWTKYSTRRNASIPNSTFLGRVPRNGLPGLGPGDSVERLAGGSAGVRSRRGAAQVSENDGVVYDAVFDGVVEPAPEQVRPVSGVLLAIQNAPQESGTADYWLGEKRKFKKGKPPSKKHPEGTEDKWVVNKVGILAKPGVKGEELELMEVAQTLEDLKSIKGEDAKISKAELIEALQNSAVIVSHTEGDSRGRDVTLNILDLPTPLMLSEVPAQIQSMLPQLLTDNAIEIWAKDVADRVIADLKANYPYADEEAYSKALDELDDTHPDVQKKYADFMKQAQNIRKIGKYTHPALGANNLIAYQIEQSIDPLLSLNNTMWVIFEETGDGPRLRVATDSAVEARTFLHQELPPEVTKTISDKPTAYWEGLDTTEPGGEQYRENKYYWDNAPKETEFYGSPHHKFKLKNMIGWTRSKIRNLFGDGFSRNIGLDMPMSPDDLADTNTRATMQELVKDMLFQWRGLDEAREIMSGRANPGNIAPMEVQRMANWLDTDNKLMKGIQHIALQGLDQDEQLSDAGVELKILFNQVHERTFGRLLDAIESSHPTLDEYMDALEEYTRDDARSGFGDELDGNDELRIVAEFVYDSWVSYVEFIENLGLPYPDNETVADAVESRFEEFIRQLYIGVDDNGLLNLEFNDALMRANYETQNDQITDRKMEMLRTIQETIGGQKGTKYFTLEEMQSDWARYVAQFGTKFDKTKDDEKLEALIKRANEIDQSSLDKRKELVDKVSDYLQTSSASLYMHDAGPDGSWEDYRLGISSTQTFLDINGNALPYTMELSIVLFDSNKHKEHLERLMNGEKRVSYERFFEIAMLVIASGAGTLHYNDTDVGYAYTGDVAELMDSAEFDIQVETLKELEDWYKPEKFLSAEDLRERSIIRHEIAKLNEKTHNIPPMPMKNTWHESVMRMTIKEALNQGLQHVAWTHSDVQSARWRNQTDEILELKWSKVDDHYSITIVDMSGNERVQMVESAELDDYVGSNNAEMIVQSPDDSGVIDDPGTVVPDSYFRDFYDGKLVDYMNKLLKPYGGKVKVIEMDNRSWWSFEIPEELAEKYRDEGVPLFDQETLPEPQKIRGMYTHGSRELAISRIANAGTLPHELSHSFIFELLDRAQAGDSDAIRDVNILIDALGAADINDLLILPSDSKQVRKEKIYRHEKLVGMYMLWLQEGNAPTPELQSIFEKFRQWLSETLEEIKRNFPGIELRDDVREVFARFHVIDAEVLSAADVITAHKMSAEQLNMKPDEYARYEKYIDGAIAQARQSLDRQVAQRANAKKSKRYRELMRQTKREVTEEVEGMRLHRTRGALYDKKNELKLDSAEVAEVLKGQSNAADIRKKVASATRKQGGQDPQTVAEAFGYSSAYEMLSDMAYGQTKAQDINHFTELRMEQALEERDDIALPNDVSTEEAQKALRSTEYENVILSEITALERLTGRKSAFPVRILKANARRLVGSLKAGELNPQAFIQKERLAAGRAYRALQQGDEVRALEEKSRQLLHQYMAREAFDRKAKQEKALKALRRLGTVAGRQGIDSSYLPHLMAVLDRFDLRQKSESEVIANAEETRAFLRQLEEDGDAFVRINDDSIIYSNVTTPWQQLTVRELEELSDALTHIAKLGRMEQTVRINGETMRLEDVVDPIALNINENLTQRDRVVPEKGWQQTLTALWVEVRKRRNIARKIDGFEDNGAMQRYVIVPITRAQGAEEERIGNEYDFLNDFFKRHDLDAKTLRKQKRAFAGGQLNLNQEQVLMLALNYGNAENKSRALETVAFYLRDQSEELVHAQSTLREIINSLTDEQWDMVEEMWQYLETFWPEVAQLEHRTTGIIPKKVEHESFEVASGRQFAGGYFPISYEPLANTRTSDLDVKTQARQEQGGYGASAMTRHGHTKERVGSGGQILKLELSTMFQHVGSVVHDLTHREAVHGAHKILKKLKPAMEDTLGPQDYQQWQKWLNRLAVGDQPATTQYERVIGVMRGRVTVMGLGLNFSTSALQLMGLTQSVDHIGPRWVAAATGEYMANRMNPKQWRAAIDEKSHVMRNRGETMNRDIRELQKQISKNRKLAKWESFLFAPIVAAQSVVDSITWTAAYNKALHNGATENDAIDIADNDVILTQSSGRIADLSGVEGGNPFLKLFTTFYSFFNTLLNLGTDRTLQLWAGNEKNITERVGGTVQAAMLLYVIPALVTSAVLDFFVAGDEPWEEDEWWLPKWAAGEMSQYLSAQLPMVRDVMPGAYGYSGPAGLRSFEAIYKALEAGYDLAPGGDPFGGENAPGMDDPLGLLTTGDARAMIDATALFAPIPSGAVKRLLGGLHRIQEGETEGPFDTFSGLVSRKAE